MMLRRGSGVFGSLLEVALLVKVGRFLLVSRCVVIVRSRLTVMLDGIRHV